jgi:lipid II:glycine glycyltransferase (peptidoglycan interpeptide bridge formation enzyme)
MEARIITDRQQWNDFVAASECCNITQSYEWGELGKWRGDVDILRAGVVDDEGKLCAAMLILVDRIPVLKQLYFYSPRGPVIDDPNAPAMTVLLNFVRMEAQRRGAFMLKVEPSVPDGDDRWTVALRKQGFRTTPYFSHPRHEWVLDLRPEEKEIQRGMKEKWRYNIRLAGRRGVTVRPSEGQDDFDAFYRLYQTTGERDRFAIHSKEFYQEVLELFGRENHARLFIAEHEGKAIAANITLWLGRWSWYMYGASSNEDRDKMPNHLIQWTAMQWAKSQGCWYYNFRGIPDVLEEGQELWGVYQFKKGFGGCPLRFIETHDLPYQPLIYQAYRSLLDIKRWRDERRYKQQQQKQPVSS